MSMKNIKIMKDNLSFCFFFWLFSGVRKMNSTLIAVEII